ncbi:hypothetical protein FUAX_17330 [Fulvitalea axinellae]|uniref:WYL domain-containing protein n=1 Tax=Fulvitalea axinellae TaxID=1182444 RepID=A0AAU9CK42_9BACT|nr:hypothetical protein FUAX_17330 [Fulvitalea axinellae]
MPANRNALIRYKTIDQCLRNRFRQWTLEDLVEACSDALYEYEGIDKGVSRRTVQLDIQMMRSDKLGYNAPIKVIDRKYYVYDDPEYSITNIPLTDQDLRKLSDAVDILKQFKGFTQVQELSGMIQKLEDSVQSKMEKQMPVIQFETNNSLKGLEHLEPLYEAILQRQAISLTYQSFKAREASTFDFHPQLLKEFRNRWFALGFLKKDQRPYLLAFDRMHKIEKSDAPYIANTTLDLSTYFSNALGVSVDYNQKVEYVELFVMKKHAPYILTKPIHHSQRLVREVPGGVIVGMDLQLNFELEKEILSFGETVKVLKPQKLYRSIRKRTLQASEQYRQNMHPFVAKETFKRVWRKGFAYIDEFYDVNEVLQFRKILKDQHGDVLDGTFLQQYPSLKTLIFSAPLQLLVKQGAVTPFQLFASNFYASSHKTEDWTFFDSLPNGKSLSRELIKDMVIISIHLDSAHQENGAFHILPRSHYWDDRNSLQNEKIVYCTVRSGGLHCRKALTRYRLRNNDPKRNVRRIELLMVRADILAEMEKPALAES